MNEIVASENKFGENLVNLWIKFSDVRESSQKTYAKALKQMFKYLRENSITEPTREDIENWKKEMLKSKRLVSIAA